MKTTLRIQLLTLIYMSTELETKHQTKDFIQNAMKKTNRI